MIYNQKVYFLIYYVFYIDLYVLYNNESVYTWIGSEFDKDSVNVDEITNSLLKEHNIELSNKVVVKEGEEPEDFWDIFE